MRNNYSLSKALNVYSLTLCNNLFKKFPKKPLVATSSKGKKINSRCSLCFGTYYHFIIRVILEIQTFLQKFLQTADLMSNYW